MKTMTVKTQTGKLNFSIGQKVKGQANNDILIEHELATITNLHKRVVIALNGDAVIVYRLDLVLNDGLPVCTYDPFTLCQVN